ncbi:unnamed protein product [Ostreobium quekettii]|uniref:PWWP domain-containing protein n=1 Tax=Ostreobium quekettii TaxID=121088 RepID=A0A8S1J470_9CHLO|nr:unnamed protein product [Ostreobium quekettii]|eukprot:evm.model.scf_306.2 EVM.evm.TU.scf_306.2   scf_306:36090-41151(-)
MDPLPARLKPWAGGKEPLPGLQQLREAHHIEDSPMHLSHGAPGQTLATQQALPTRGLINAPPSTVPAAGSQDGRMASSAPQLQGMLAGHGPNSAPPAASSGYVALNSGLTSLSLLNNGQSVYPMGMNGYTMPLKALRPGWVSQMNLVGAQGHATSHGLPVLKLQQQMGGAPYKVGAQVLEGLGVPKAHAAQQASPHTLPQVLLPHGLARATPQALSAKLAHTPPQALPRTLAHAVPAEGMPQKLAHTSPLVSPQALAHMSPQTMAHMSHQEVPRGLSHTLAQGLPQAVALAHHQAPPQSLPQALPCRLQQVVWQPRQVGAVQAIQRPKEVYMEPLQALAASCPPHAALGPRPDPVHRIGQSDPLSPRPSGRAVPLQAPAAKSAAPERNTAQVQGELVGPQVADVRPSPVLPQVNWQSLPESLREPVRPQVAAGPGNEATTINGEGPVGENAATAAGSSPMKVVEEAKEVGGQANDAGTDEDALWGDVPLRPIPCQAMLGLKPGRRLQIKPKEWAGQVVWARMSSFCWWPAQVIDESNPFIPVDSRACPRHGAVPVRFFGTYDFAWIEAQRNLSPFDQDFDDRRAEGEGAGFFKGVQEALIFQKTGHLPRGFEDAMSHEAQTEVRTKPKAKAKAVKGKTTKRKSDEPAGGAAERHRKDAPSGTICRKLKVMRSLALSPPAGSPYASQVAINPNLRALVQAAASNGTQ